MVSRIKLSRINQWIHLVPTPAGGLALGVASLGVLWSTVLPERSGLFLALPVLFSMPLILLIVLKFCLYSQLLVNDLRHPVVGSVMPTSCMAAMVVAQVLLPELPVLARALWLTAIVLHLSLLAGFSYFRWKDFSGGCYSYEQMVPSWFIPPIGIIVAVVTGNDMSFPSLVQWLLIFGLVSYGIELPLMLYRIIFRDRMANAVLPTFAVMAAPASLSMAGYLTASSQPDHELLLLLTALALCMTGLVYISFIRLLRLPFSPGYAAFTFPLVIGATALFKLSIYLESAGFSQGAILFHRLAWGELIVATVMVGYVTLCYLQHYGQAIADAHKGDNEKLFNSKRT